jgi:hypothetical protein
MKVSTDAVGQKSNGDKEDSTQVGTSKYRISTGVHLKVVKKETSN